MYDPFNDYFGLSGLLSNCRVNDDFISTPFHHNDDFNSNGVNVPVMSRSVSSISDMNNNMVSGLPVSTSQSSTASTGFMPLQLPLNIAEITELSKVMRGGRRANNGRGGAMGVGGRPPSWCVFCKNNGESEMVYASHKLKSEEGITTCPILRAYTCPLCGTNGDRAHTIKYCPVNKYKDEVVGSSSGPGTIGSQYRTPRTSTGRRRTSSLSLSSGGSSSSYIG